MSVVWLACSRNRELGLCCQDSRGPASSQECHQYVVLELQNGTVRLHAIRIRTYAVVWQHMQRAYRSSQCSKSLLCSPVLFNERHLPDGYALTAGRRPKPVNAERHQSIPPLIKQTPTVHFHVSIAQRLPHQERHKAESCLCP